MTLQIELPSDVETRLRGEAQRRGIDTSEYARQLIERALPGKPDLSTNAWPKGYFENTYGSTADDPLQIPEDPIPLPEEIE